MKIVVINLSGNTGKTTLTKHMFKPLLQAARISIEDVNAGDGPVDLEIGANKFKSLAAELNTADDAKSFVIDVGASNAKSMLANFDQLSSTTDLIDAWIIPATPSSKQIVDSLRTAESLKELGIDPKKITILPNNISDLDSFESDFSHIFLSRQFGFVVPENGILATEAFSMLRNDSRSIFDIVNNKPDFAALKAELRKADDKEGLVKLGHEMVLFDLSRHAAKNVQAIFNELPYFKVSTKKGQKNG